MPCLLVPVHEYNHCHDTTGKFCSDPEQQRQVGHNLDWYIRQHGVDWLRALVHDMQTKHPAQLKKARRALQEYNRCHTPSGPAGGQFCPTGPAPTLRYFNMKYGGFTAKARREWLKRSPAARHGVELANEAWERKYGKKKTRRG